jgi:FdhD protein
MGSSYQNQHGKVQTTAVFDTLRLIDGRFNKEKTRVVIEKELSIHINKEYFATASVSGGMELEFVTGYLFGQGFITGPDEMESIDIEGDITEVTAKNIKKLSKRTDRTEYRIVSGGGKSAFFGGATFKPVSDGMRINRDSVFRAMNTIFEKGELYKKTGGVHASGLFTPEAEPICIAEDIGRHNTLDKVIGYSLINKVDFRQTFLVSTGRMASEMVSKICRAGIPIVATKTAVTKLGIEIGEKCGLTIIGFVKDKGTKTNTDMSVRIAPEKGMKIYTNPQRVVLN